MSRLLIWKRVFFSVLYWLTLKGLNFRPLRVTKGRRRLEISDRLTVLLEEEGSSSSSSLVDLVRLIADDRGEEVVRAELVRVGLLLTALGREVTDDCLGFVLGEGRGEGTGLGDAEDFRTADVRAGALDVITGALETDLEGRIAAAVGSVIISLTITTSTTVSPAPSTALAVGRGGPRNGEFASATSATG